MVYTKQYTKPASTAKAMDTMEIPPLKTTQTGLCVSKRINMSSLAGEAESLRLQDGKYPCNQKAGFSTLHDISFYPLSWIMLSPVPIYLTLLEIT